MKQNVTINRACCILCDAACGFVTPVTSIHSAAHAQHKFVAGTVSRQIPEPTGGGPRNYCHLAEELSRRREETGRMQKAFPVPILQTIALIPPSPSPNSWVHQASDYRQRSLDNIESASEVLKGERSTEERAKAQARAKA